MSSTIKFIAFEGIEGSGKSTQADRSDHWLTERGIDHLLVREPGSTPLGERVRELLLMRKEIELAPSTEALLYLTARAQLVEEVIAPALIADKVVLSDRYSHSTLAYQGYGLGLDLTDLENACEFAGGGLWPDLVILIDLPPDVGLSRIADAGSSPDRIEGRGLAFHERVRDGYLAMAKQDKETFVVIDGEGTEDEVWRRVEEVLAGVLGEK